MNATKKDIDVITSIKLVTMIDDVMDKKLSHEERKKIEEAIKKEIKEDYDKYQVIYVNKKRAGVYIAVPYKNGVMIDEIYLFDEYRNKGIGTSIINKMYRFLKRLGFVEFEKNNRITIMRINDAATKLLETMVDIKNGYADRKGNYYHVCKDDFYDVFYLQKPQDL